MEEYTSSKNIIFSKNVIEFVTVATETCLFLEKADTYLRNNFIEQSVKILPLLYLKASVLEKPTSIYEDIPEKFVTQEEYEYIHQKIEQLLGTDNIYLEVFDQNMQYSDTPVAAFISENLADIYQELKDFAMNYSLEIPDIMHDALVYCLESFSEHWGQKLLNALRALHALRHDEEFDSHEEKDTELNQNSIDRNTFVDFLRNDE